MGPSLCDDVLEGLHRRKGRKEEGPNYRDSWNGGLNVSHAAKKRTTLSDKLRLMYERMLTLDDFVKVLVLEDR